ncbi:MFS transporter [Candidatus Daviesbacteria bacterium]|nr:MFS transporter [Candidatus Daviesbacteria bacterium]
MNDAGVLKNIKLLTWFSFFIDFRFYYPIAILYFSQIAGSYALGMLVFGVINISQALAEVPTGIFSDFIGRKRTMLLGALTAFFAVFCYALGFSYWVLIAGAIFEGLAFSFFSGNNEAFLHDTLKEKDMEKEYPKYHGRMSGMTQLAGGISAVAGGVLAFYSFPLAIWLSLISLGICILITFFFIEPKVVSEKSTNIYNHLTEAVKLFIKNSNLRLLSFSSILSYALGESGWLFRSAFFATLWPVWALGIPQMLGNLGAALGFFAAGRAIGRFGAKRLLIFGSLFAHTANILAFGYVTIFSPLLAVLGSPFFGISNTARSSLFQKEFSDKQRATMGSLNSFAGSLFFAVVSFGLGFIADLLSPARGLLILQLLMLVNIFVYWKLLKK